MAKGVIFQVWWYGAGDHTSSTVCALKAFTDVFENAITWPKINGFLCPRDLSVVW